MNVILLGAPGAGKGTQAERISKIYNLKHISTGDLFRYEVSKETELGLKAKSYMDRGELVPDQVVVDMVEEHLPDSQGFLLDGFPRTIEQAEALGRSLHEKNKDIQYVINIDVPHEELIERMIARGRSDDNKVTVENRLDVYHRQTKPLIVFYDNKGVLHHVQGAQPIEKVTQEVEHILGDVA